MIQAIFCDFYGTLVPEYGPASYEVIRRVCESGIEKNPKAVVAAWWKRYGEKQQAAWGDAFRTQYELALESYRELLEEYHSSEDPKALCDKMAEHWAAPGLCEGSAEFLAGCGLPVWLVTNSDTGYVEQAVRQCGISPAGIVTSEMARCPKPHPGIYQLALQLAGLAPDQVVHIGDSLQGDALGPAKLGIRTIWLNPEGRPVPEGVTAAASLADALEILRGWQQAEKE